MLLVLELDVADLAGTRFAISPLSETLRAVQLKYQQHAPHLAWLFHYARGFSARLKRSRPRPDLASLLA